MIKLKSKYLIFSAVFLLIVILLLNLSFLRDTAKRYLPDNFKNIIKVTIFGEEYLREINLNKISNYNF